FVTEFEKAGGLEDLRVIPTLAKVPEGVKGPDGAWTGTSMLYWCLSYNTRLVKQGDLPKTWEDLLFNPIWRGGNFALGNRPNLFVGNLWMVKGEKWAKDFVTKLFTEVKPQLRKEGMNSLAQLAAAGEFYGVAPSNYRRVFQMAEEGAPVSFHCPEPVPSSTEEAVILKGSPHPNAAKVFLNWLLSKEGQIARYYGGGWGPVHKELQRKEFLPFSEEIVGKKQAFRDPVRIDEVMPPLFEYWNALWLKGVGTAR
ncbi:MAG TPA: extracellular solute-binding protein, partial [Candidatus Binatia bacterium]